VRRWLVGFSFAILIPKLITGFRSIDPLEGANTCEFHVDRFAFPRPLLLVVLGVCIGGLSRSFLPNKPSISRDPECCL
jgi:hypothetical protein